MLYISSLFQERYNHIYQQLENNIETIQIPNTKDIWIRDFMPIRNTDNEYILFRYFPKYLQAPKYQHLISDNKAICDLIKIDVLPSSIILGGGAVVYKNEVYFISQRVFDDNPQYSSIQLQNKLSKLLKTEKLIFLPEAPQDFTGHLDGVIAILDEKIILLNHYQGEYGETIQNIIKKHDFEIELLPYNPYKNKTYQSAKGIYINFIETEKQLFVPVFNQTEDQSALSKLSSLFPHKKITPLLCNDLAKEGGLLHCVSWEK